MNGQNEQAVNVIEFNATQVLANGNFVEYMGYDDQSSFIERVPIFTIVETEVVPPLQSAITDRAKQLLSDQGFTRNKEAEFGRNNRDEVWTKKTNYAASAETIKLARIVLHDVLKDNDRIITDLSRGIAACMALIDEKQSTINPLQSKIKTATLWQRVKFLFGGEL